MSACVLVAMYSLVPTPLPSVSASEIGSLIWLLQSPSLCPESSSFPCSLYFTQERVANFGALKFLAPFAKYGPQFCFESVLM